MKNIIAKIYEASETPIFVVLEQNGKNDPWDLVSVWSNKQEAIKEMHKRSNNDLDAGGDAYNSIVVQMELDSPLTGDFDFDELNIVAKVK